VVRTWEKITCVVGRGVYIARRDEEALRDTSSSTAISQPDFFLSHDALEASAAPDSTSYLPVAHTSKCHSPALRRRGCSRLKREGYDMLAAEQFRQITSVPCAYVPAGLMYSPGR
jgi:hypothetical protein